MHAIKAKIVKNYNLNDFRSFYSKPSKIYNENNYCLFLTIRPILKMLIYTEGLKIGSSLYKIRPQTTVYRCFHCQQVGHLSHFTVLTGLHPIDNNCSNLSNWINYITSPPAIYIKPVIIWYINPLTLITLVINLHNLTKPLNWITNFCNQLIFNLKILLFKMVLSLNILSFHHRGLSTILNHHYGLSWLQ